MRLGLRVTELLGHESPFGASRQSMTNRIQLESEKGCEHLLKPLKLIVIFRHHRLDNRYLRATHFSLYLHTLSSTMQAEIEAYEYQLSQVTLALDADPSNSELVSLKSELEELISLTKMASGSVAPDPATPAPVSSAKEKGKGKEVLASGSPAPAPSFLSSAVASGSGSPSAVTRPKFNAGDECTAKYKDGKWSVV